MWCKRLQMMLVAVACGGSIALTARAQEYEIGGPLAGLKLPLFQGQHGEPPGHPGCVPELLTSEPELTRDTLDLQPERDLYPGSVEHYRAYWFKYCPIRSFFDRQSQVRNFLAKDTPGVAPVNVEQYAAPVYYVPRHAPVRDTGKKLNPVPVVRCKAGTGRPVFKLDLGELGEGLYVVRVIGAVETAQLRPFRKSLLLRMRVNDTGAGETSDYKFRGGYCDEFYGVAEFYFHAPERRQYRAELWADPASEVDLLVHNISLDDVLAGTARRALKTRMTLNAPKPQKPAPASRYPAEGRLARDAAIWNWFPPLNAQGSGHMFTQAAFVAIFPTEVTFGAEGKTRDEVNNSPQGAWTSPGTDALAARLELSTIFSNPANWNVFLANRQLGLKYTLDDLRNHRPLPDPYPYKDDGTGIIFPDPKDPGKGQIWCPVAIEVMERIRACPSLISASAQRWRQQSDSDAARDGAIALARYAYSFPTITSGNYFSALARDPGAYGRNYWDRRRETEAMFQSHYMSYLQSPQLYDALFDYIQGNQELADSIRRFVPWVKTPQDVIKLIDVYLVQTTAKRILRYHYYTEPMAAGDLAAVLGPNDVTAPWIDWLFARTFYYPSKPAGVQELMITGCDREGAKYIGSIYYAGDGASGIAESIERFRDAGILPRKYNLTDTALYPKPLAHCSWILNTIVGGRDFCRIGDVAGPDKGVGATLGRTPAASSAGWRWSGDPRFAWVLKNMVGRKGESDEEWARIEKAAATVKRAPWLDNRSRQVYNWIGVLEAGLQHDDFRQRRAAYVRVGAGIGHQHEDTLDLQVFAHGVPMTIDGGQRPGYCTPGDSATRVHNTVQVNGRGHLGQAWVSTLSDVEGARYLLADAAPPEGTTLFRRAIALIDVDENEAVQQGRTPNSYVFDVFRVSGGKEHMYSFHGPISDEVVTNALDFRPVPAPAQGQEGNEDAQYLRPFKRSPESWKAGDAPPVLVTTWRYSRAGRGNEQALAGGAFRMDSPRKFTRLHLFDPAPGEARVLHADAVCFQWGYKYLCQMVRKKAAEQELESAFVGIVEPYVGEPFIVSARNLDIAENEKDALKAVALEVKTANAHTDVCFADGRPERIRQIRNPDFEARVSGEYGFCSKDADGLRLVALTRGTLFESPDVTIRLAQREYAARVTEVDYLTKTMRIDSVWPVVCAGSVFEIGSPERTTSYTSAEVRPAAGGTFITVTRGADYYRSSILSLDPKEGKAVCQLSPALGKMPGLDRNFIASNDDMTKFWRADFLGDETFVLKGAPVSLADFGESRVLRLWEYGVGDAVRMSTFASLRRIQPMVFELAANADVTILLPARGVETSADMAAWKAISAERVGEKAQVRIKTSDLSPEGKIYLRLQ